MNFRLPLILLLAFCATTASAAAYNRVLPVLDADKDAIATGILIGKYVVLTAAHAVHVADQPFTCGDQPAMGHLVKLDMKHDLALFALEKPCEGVDVTPIAKHQPAEGESIVIQGYPGTNVRRTVSGVVANYETLAGPPVARAYMILDLLVSGGNSGGPVLNSKGELVGMVQAKLCYKGPPTLPPTCYGAAIVLASIKGFLEGVPL